MTSKKILVYSATMLDILEPHVSRLKSMGYEVVANPAFLNMPYDEILNKHLPGTCALLSGGSGISREQLHLADSLKVISIMASGYEAVDVPLLTEAGIVLTNTPIPAMAEPVAELAFGLMYSLAREIPRYDRLIKAKQYERGFGRLVWGKTLGIIGLGNIGKELAKRARGVSMEILAHDVWIDEAFAREWNVKYVELDELLEKSDYISLHLRINEKTKGIIGKRELALMKPSAYLINTARMGLIDEQALAECLKSGGIAGAALDFGPKPPHSSEIFTLDNVIATPHLGNRVLENAHAVIECGYGTRWTY